MKETIKRITAQILILSAIRMNVAFISNEVQDVQLILLGMQVICLVWAFVRNRENLADAAIGGALVASFISPINKWLTAKASALEGIQAGVIPVFALIGIVGSIFLWVFIIHISNKPILTKFASLLIGASAVGVALLSGILINLLIKGKSITFGGNIAIFIGILGFSAGAYALTKCKTTQYLLVNSMGMLFLRIADSLILAKLLKKSLGFSVSTKSLIPLFMVGIAVRLYSSALRNIESLENKKKGA